MSVNKALLIGRLGHDPEMKTFDSGRTKTSFKIATNRTWKDKANGERQERTDWHRIVTWGKTAELAHRCLSKGRQVCVEGRIETRKFQDKEGQDRWITEVVANNLTFLDSKNQESQGPPVPLYDDPGVPF